MKIRSRLEFFLAKVAGKDADVTGLVPAGASDTVEGLLLDIADRFDGIDEAIEDISDASTPANATAEKAGVVKMAANVAGAAGEAPTAAEFKALIDALIAAGIMAAPATA